ncbi:enoyl-CoA hydratase/isomerase family protein [Deinococcus sp. Arct2-2]|uniref:enoyl-CoA hydratase/isomerase family protein n=1 Tax=Deinococcus sp. Arct2-2 TaxID=2568653 RepID=UPI0010A4B259|nr:enoyl-CoA hydratase/isomerase family protein [Deinococcus sp. Arct2-2]THF71163.1 enoyl-CoA hydratase/isomerase family protein [Deinococcus sp. Arct2-2]
MSNSAPDTGQQGGTGAVKLSQSAGVATLTFTHPKAAFGPATWLETAQALGQLGEARVLILRGERHFSVGLDVKATAPSIAAALNQPNKHAAFKAVVDEMHAAIEGLAALPIPVIAAIDGWCIGAGLELAAACDIRIATASARFSLPEVRLGITADLGGLQRLPGIIGRGRAAHLALNAEPIDATTAERWGLVTELHADADALYARAEALAAHLAALPPKALEGTKRTLNDGLPHAQSLAAAVDWNAEHMTAEGLAGAVK